nr:uncharacterized protein LOC129058389 [Pongo abelii]
MNFNLGCRFTRFCSSAKGSWQRNPQFSRHLPRSLHPAAGWPLAPAAPPRPFSSPAPGAQPISEAPTLPSPSPGRRRRAFPHSYSLEESHRLQIQPTSQSIFAKSLTKISLSRPRPLLPRRLPSATATKCPSLLLGLAHKERGLGLCSSFSSPKAVLPRFPESPRTLKGITGAVRTPFPPTPRSPVPPSVSLLGMSRESARRFPTPSTTTKKE